MKLDHRDERLSIVLDLTRELKKKGSWCGETHIQKTVYILKSFGVEKLDYDFILYKHGPYSFDLHNDIALVRDARLVSLVVLQDRYGPSFEVSDTLGTRFLDKHEPTIKEVKKKINFVVEWLGDKDVKSLERISTALMITLENPASDVGERSAALNRIKPHISLVEAESAIKTVDYRRIDAKKAGILR